MTLRMPASRLVNQVLKPVSTCMYRRFTRLFFSSVGHFSNKAAPGTSSNSTVNKQVLLSTSNDIYRNLAFEDWLYDNADLTERSILLIWRNGPVVVCGRHQNPWLDINVPLVRRSNIPIVRRKSGGGTVYHDLGNVNISVLTSRLRHHRKGNLEMVMRALQSRWDLDLTLNNRDDILLDGLYKVSGTAAKLAGKTAYHHFTLLLDVDLTNIEEYLFTNMLGLKTKATVSTRSRVKNLIEADPKINFYDVIMCLSEGFLRFPAARFEEIYPEETMFPGLDEKISELQSWAWVFGRSPKFSVHRKFSYQHSHKNHFDMDITATIDKGHFTDIAIQEIGEPQLRTYLCSISDYLRGHPLDIEEIERSLHAGSADNSPERTITWIRNCLKETFSFC